MPSNHPSRDRHLTWPACYNTRDLSGLLTVDGRQTDRQAVIRSDTLGRLTPQGRQALLDYGVRTIIDLRAPKEAQADVPAFTRPDHKTDEPAYLNLLLEKYYPHVSALINQAATRAEVYCLILDHYPEAVAEVMRAIANAQTGGVVIHCHAGKDRTGMVAGLLLSLVGVPADIVAADYAESQERLWPVYEQLVAQAGGEDKVGFWAKPTVIPEMMLDMLAHIEAAHGGVQPYLTAAGLSSVDMARLKKRLCAPRPNRNHAAGWPVLGAKAIKASVACTASPAERA
ncbi:MAG TPA: tyrosine-protein phosphatase [Anaerolineae bacterium]